MTIRFEKQGDASAIHALVVAAFGQPQEAQLVDALRASGNSVISLVDEEPSGAIVGHVLLSKMRKPPGSLGLAPVSVSPARQKTGIGSGLINRALQLAKEDQWRAVFVLGAPAYYTRFGFRLEGAAKFETPYPKEYFMALELQPGGLSMLSGVADYAAPFSMFEET